MARNCDFVPLRLEFAEGRTAGTAFEGQTALKLGTHCRGDKDYEKYTLREYLTYRLFNMVTPLSFRARLGPGHLRRRDVEEDRRHPLRHLHRARERRRPPHRRPRRRAAAHQVHRPRAPTLTRMMMFEYMIGNTDFSIWALHNVRIVQDRARRLIRCPYDFDLSGLRPPALRDPRPAHRHPQRRSIACIAARAAPPRNSTRSRQRSAPSASDMLALIDSMSDLEPCRAGRKRRTTWRASSGRSTSPTRSRSSSSTAASRSRRCSKLRS